jgi:L-lactate dehydrogenase (cytochrome)
MSKPRLISVSEISSHNKDTDCWVVIDNQVWDITSFAPNHPGGPGIIYKYAGRDATEAYSAIHAPSIIKEGLASDKLIGNLDPSIITAERSQPRPSETSSAARHSSEKPPLESLINAHDFELAARNSASAKTWAFYSSAANDLVTRDANASLYNRIWLRPRVMRDVTHYSTATSIFGIPISMPLLISPAAMARLIHPDGELALARAAHTHSIIQCISTSASYTATEITQQASLTSHPFFFQLYVDRERHKTESLMKMITSLPNIAAIFVTTDAAAAGKREADERVKADESISSPMHKNSAKNDKRGGGYGRLMGSFIDPALSWTDIAWLRKQTSLPLCLKGIMSADDVVMAFDHGLDGVMLSNHGGRNLDTSPPAILILLECHARFPYLFTHHHPSSTPVRTGTHRPFTILIDGGIRRGTDILKSLCLGAVAVGVGRPFLFATAYGQAGAEHLIEILQDELEVGMRNCGITSVEGCGPEYVNTGDLEHLVVKTREHPYAKDWREKQVVKARL